VAPGGRSGDEDRRERGGRVWLWKVGERDAVVVGVGIVVVEGENGVRRADAGNGALSEMASNGGGSRPRGMM
jgi:hypothetical protein